MTLPWLALYVRRPDLPLPPSPQVVELLVLNCVSMDVTDLQPGLRLRDPKTGTTVSAFNTHETIEKVAALRPEAAAALGLHSGGLDQEGKERRVRQLRQKFGPWCLSSFFQHHAAPHAPGDTLYLVPMRCWLVLASDGMPY